MSQSVPSKAASEAAAAQSREATVELAAVDAADAEGRVIGHAADAVVRERRCDLRAARQEHLSSHILAKPAGCGTHRA